MIISFSRLFPSTRSFNSVAIALSALLMAGCANLAPHTDAGTDNVPDDATQSPASRPYHEAIDLDGRLSVQYQRNGEDESLHGSFTWRQTARHSTITLLSPLGQTLAAIAVEADSATLTQSGQAPRTASDVDELAAQSLGWPLPVSGLRSWLQGFATNANGKTFAATPDNNDVTTNDGWHIRYVIWDDSDPATIRPKRIDLERQTEQAGKVAIRIVIDNWQTH